MLRSAGSNLRNSRKPKYGGKTGDGQYRSNVGQLEGLSAAEFVGLARRDISARQRRFTGYQIKPTIANSMLPMNASAPPITVIPVPGPTYAEAGCGKARNNAVSTAKKIARFLVIMTSSPNYSEG